jgi:hypothetical protein
MTNPALIELVANDRITEIRAAAAQRSVRAGRSVPTEAAPRQPSSRSIPHVHLANPQRAIGWFLVSVGLRLALPRTRAGAAQ